MPVIRCPVGCNTHCNRKGDAILRRPTGAFGSGAAFALEDGWILARAIEYAQAHERPLHEALEIFDEIRSPYYLRM